jgi:hypothetical protein
VTQRERVLRALRRAGATGLTQADWLRQPTPDGGRPITRLAARVHELREEHEITVDGMRDSFPVYVLRPSPAELQAVIDDAAKQRLRGPEPEPAGHVQLTIEDAA